MRFFLKGLQQQFILSLKDEERLLNWLFSNNYFIFKAYVDNEEEKRCILSSNDILLNSKRLLQYFIVSNEQADKVTWNRISLKSGGERFEFDPLLSQAVQVLLSPYDEKRIGVGRVSVCTLWEDDDGNRQKTENERNIYQSIKKIIKTICVGSIYSKVWIGDDAYNLWTKSDIKLAYDLNNPDEYEVNDYAPFC
ncbi:MAG: hypothetical protein RBS37_00185 [Bacteroidales bacterium]|jgi:hypothetical protein|nr:hypothetical protein [Bacteroidales bacterium]